MKRKKIMFVLLKTLGDVMLGTTICHELKRDFPDSDIFFYTNAAYVPILGNNPDIHQVKVSDEWGPDMIFMDMVRSNYDQIFIPYQIRRECNIWHQEEPTRHQHLVDFYWGRMGMHRSITDRECYLYPDDQDYLNAKRHISFDVPRIAIHSTTGVLTKDWPYFEELTEECRKAGFACVQVGAKTDKGIEKAVDLRGKMGLLELAAFLSNCAAFVGLDSGVSYIADTMKIPTIVIQGSTNPVTSGPISDRVIHLFAQETGYDDCQVIRCHTNCRHDVNCITKISVEDVLTKIDETVNAWRRPIPVEV